MNGLRRAALLSFFVLLLAGCARQPVTAFADRTPQFHVEQFYNGHSRGYGFFFSRGGDVVKRM